MRKDQRSWPMFNVETLMPLSDEERQTVSAACEAFNERFNGIFDKQYRYTWTASPLNLGNLDYDFYEFGGGHWYADNGYGFTCAWGEILVHSFGFQWMKMAGAENLRDYVLKHEEASYVFFPWQRLWSIVESAGWQQEKGTGAWMQILDQVHAIYGLPAGWHLLTDVVLGEVKWVPPRAAEEMKTLLALPDWSFGNLGLWPYEWNRKSDWNWIENHLKMQRIKFHDS